VSFKTIRKRLGLSQERFAATQGFAVSAVRDWEQGRRQPERSAHFAEDRGEGARGGDAGAGEVDGGNELAAVTAPAAVIELDAILTIFLS
jgi:hypothetical protein